MHHIVVKKYKWLYPIAFLYGMGVRLRNQLFDLGLLRSRSFDIPVISVGNLAVGGTGKTPHTEYLIRLLQQHFQVAVLSRGYKRKSRGYLLADAQTPMPMIGDEPFQMKQKFPSIHMAVDKDRCHGIDCLSDEALQPQTDVILLDDAYQHRYVKPGISILLTDFHRPLNEDALLPAGRLREPQKEKSRANIVIVTKCPRNLKPMDFRVIIKQMNLYPYQKLFFSTLKYGALTPLYADAPTRALESLQKQESVLLLTGIAVPQQLIKDLTPYTSAITPLHFADHHQFTAKDAALITSTFMSMKGEERIIITTEKDATRLGSLPLSNEIKEKIYTLPVEIEFLQGQGEQFNQNILNYVRTNSRNSILLKGKNAH